MSQCTTLLQESYTRVRVLLESSFFYWKSVEPAFFALLGPNLLWLGKLLFKLNNIITYIIIILLLPKSPVKTYSYKRLWCWCSRWTGVASCVPTDKRSSSAVYPIRCRTWCVTTSSSVAPPPPQLHVPLPSRGAEEGGEVALDVGEDLASVWWLGSSIELVFPLGTSVHSLGYRT